MADLDADLQRGNTGATFSALTYEDHFQLTADLQNPLIGTGSDLSHCTCEQETPTPTINTVSVAADENELVITFSTDVVLSGPALEVANWFVTTEGPGREVTIGSIEFSGTTVTLTTTPQTLDAEYTLHLPTLGITSDVFGVFTGLYSLDFVGVATVVNVQMVKVVDTHHLDVIFAIPVTEETAGDPLNYSINNGLTITEAVRVTDQWYRVRNEPRQVDATSYTITITNIEAL